MAIWTAMSLVSVLCVWLINSLSRCSDYVCVTSVCAVFVCVCVCVCPVVCKHVAIYAYVHVGSYRVA